MTGNCFGSSGVGDLLRTLHVEHIQNSPSLLVAIGGAYSLGQNLALHEQARIWISWCCRMFGILRESLCGEWRREVDYPGKSVLADYSYLYR